MIPVSARYPLGEWCECVSDHSPKAYVANRHHVVPLSWGGSDDSSNVVMLCPNSHSAVHRLLDEYVRNQGTPDWALRRQFGAYIRELAMRAWDQRPEKPTYTSKNV
jgi:hypothetical protein